MPLLAQDLMWSKPPMLSPDSTLKMAAKKMQEADAGVLPVGVDGRVAGIITDRDIVLRAVAKGKNIAQEKVADFMTSGIYSCKEGDTIDSAAKLMKKNKISRLVVVDGQNRLSGILSFGHIFRDETNAEEATDIITRIAGKHVKSGRK